MPEKIVKTITPTGNAVSGQVVHRSVSNSERFFNIVESSMRMCVKVAQNNLAEDPKLAVGAAVAAGRLAQIGHGMVLAEERAEMAREDHDDKHLRLAGRTSSTHARVRQARAERRLIEREEREIQRNMVKEGLPRW